MPRPDFERDENGSHVKPGKAPGFIRMNPEQYPLIHEGSSKNKHDCGDGTIIFVAKSTYSVFDVGIAPDLIPGKDRAITACYVKSAKIAKNVGVRTHFIEQVADNAVRVHGVQVINGRHPNEKDSNFLVPLELIYRIDVAGSKLRNFREGKENPADYGFSPGYIPTEFDYFPWPVSHHTTKFEKVDRTLTNAVEICQIGGISLLELNRIWDIIFRVTGAVNQEMARAGYICFDGKVEPVLLGLNRMPGLGDFFGTPDEDRPVGKEEFNRGELLHFSKEFIRELHIKSGYYARLQSARKANQPDPPIPNLSEMEIAEISWRYCKFTCDYAGVTVSI